MLLRSPHSRLRALSFSASKEETRVNFIASASARSKEQKLKKTTSTHRLDDALVADLGVRVPVHAQDLDGGHHRRDVDSGREGVDRDLLGAALLTDLEKTFFIFFGWGKFPFF